MYSFLFPVWCYIVDAQAFCTACYFSFWLHALMLLRDTRGIVLVSQQLELESGEKLVLLKKKIQYHYMVYLEKMQFFDTKNKQFLFFFYPTSTSCPSPSLLI